MRAARRTHGTGSVRVVGTNYYGRWRADGKQVERKLGAVRQPHTTRGLTKGQAETKLRELMGIATTVTERVTVAQAAAAYVSHREALGIKSATIRSYRSIVNSRIVPRIGDQAIGKLTRLQVEHTIRKMLDDGASAKTVRNTIGLLSAIGNYSVKQGWAVSNPAAGADLPRVHASTEIHYLDSDEIETLLTATTDRFRRTLYLCAAMTGLRQGELLALRWKDIDWPGRRVHVRRNYSRGEFVTPKSGKGRIVPMPDRLAAALDDLHQHTSFSADDAFVFGNSITGDVRNASTLLDSFNRDRDRAGVRKVRFHDLRHSYGTRLASAGVPLREIQEYMGHAHITTTEIYAAFAPAGDGADRVGAAFGAGADGLTVDASLNSSLNLRRSAVAE
jgi:integrase